MRPSINLTSLLLSVILLPSCLSRDSITVGTITYPGGNTLVSAGGRFELGFFSPKGSSDSRRYVGIWYYRSDPLIIVWVAKRDDPLVGHTWFGLVGGNLQLRNETRSIQLTDAEGSNSSNRFAKLLDSGNLVLVEGESILWQSFDYPTDTFLLGMRMTGDFKLTSWASHDDPKQGNFTFQRDSEGDPEVIFGKLSPYWKSGVYDKFIETDTTWYIISFLLANLSTDTTATSLQSATSPTSAYENINRSDYDYNDVRLVMNYSGHIQFFKPGNGSKLVWFNPAGNCSVFNACGKFGICNGYNGSENMCRCLPGFEPVEPGNWNLRDYSSGCKRKTPICQKNNDNRANDFLSLKMMKVGDPDNQIKVGSEVLLAEEECRRNCLDVCGCQAYSLEERQRRGTESRNLTCYTWSKDLDNMQESVAEGHSLSVRVLLSDIEPTEKSCGACGTNLIPYPLSTRKSCGDPLYFAFRCDNNTAQLYFEWHSSGYRVTSIDPEAKTFTIQVGDAFNCTSSGLMELNQQPKTTPFSISSWCIGGQNYFSSEMKIKWKDPAEPLCNLSKDCDWLHATCKSASDATKRCRCDAGFSWNSSSVNCSFAGNHFERAPEKRQKVKLVYIIAPASATIIILVFVGLSYMARKHSSTQGSRERTQENPDFRLYDSEKRIKLWMDSCQFEDDGKKGIDVPHFDLDIILQATNNFSDENKLGRGGFGPVYKATFPGGQEIAVKRLLSGSGQGLEEFKNEVVLIAKLQHRNLVRLVGYCVRGDEKMLLYEYMPNKSLDSFIFDRTRCWLLTWEIRFEIILGIARGILYLHQDSRLRIIHRDLKTSNVLLDEEMTPKISDFGLARIFEAKQTEASTQRVIGTYFGVVVLEIISGRRNTGFYQSEGTMSLLTHAWKLWNANKALELMDRVLHDKRDQILKCINVALLCVQEDPSDRPTMSDAVFMLGSENATLPVPQKPAFAIRIGFSTTASSSSGKPESCAALSISLEQGR